MGALTAFKILLARYTGQQDICVGSPIANRTKAEIEPLIGMFVNTLALRSDLSGNPSFSQLLIQVKATTLTAYEHQDLPFEQVVEAVQPQRQLSHSPLFQVMLILQNTPQASLTLPGMALRVEPIEQHTAKFDITLTLNEDQHGLSASLEYNVDLFQKTTIQRFAKHFSALLTAIVEQPEQNIHQLSFLSDAEKHQHLPLPVHTSAASPCLPSLFDAQVAASPHATAVCFGEQSLSYAQLKQKADLLATHLRQQGLKPDTLVIICVERSIDMVVGFWVF